MMLVAALCLSVSNLQASKFDPGPNPLLMRHPTVSLEKIAFQYAGDIWTVPIRGGEAQRLTSAVGTKSDPFFSPDGTEIAFTANYDGNTDVYVMPSSGGTPKRLTAHPAVDHAVGWTPDGKSVLFSSSMLSNTDHPRLFTVSRDGGVPKPLPLPSGVQGSFSPDGKQLAYVAHDLWEQAWKRYRGGQTTSIWIADLATSKVKAIPRNNTMDKSPVWLGDSIYYLTDKEGPVGLNRYVVSTGKVEQCVKGEGFDFKSATAGPGCIALEKLGSIWLYDLPAKKLVRVPIQIHGDFLETRAEFKNVERNVQSVGISPTGQRALVAARGWVFTVPVKKGDTRLLDGPQGVFRRDPAWSPDGKSIAFITDQRGPQELAIRDATTGAERLLSLGDPPGYYSDLTWSPNSQKITYIDTRLHIWVLDLATGKNAIIDSGTYRADSDISPRWSPDSNWLTWSRDLDTHVDAVFVKKLGPDKPVMITDGFAEATQPVFSSDGKYLYFLASTDSGLALDFEDVSRLNAATSTENVFALVLRKSLPNPLEPESDEEGIKPSGIKRTDPRSAEPSPAFRGGEDLVAKIDESSSLLNPLPQRGRVPRGMSACARPREDGQGGGINPNSQKSAEQDLLEKGDEGAQNHDVAKKDADKFDIDLGGLERRIIAVPLAKQHYTQLGAGPNGTLFALSASGRGGASTLYKYGFADRKVATFSTGVSSFTLSADSNKILLDAMGGYRIVSAAAPADSGDGRIDLSDLRVKIDPKLEWNAMYHEVWNNERLLLYDPHMHGIDSFAMEKRYEPFLANIVTREDLNYLFTDMLGEICIGHMFIGGGDIPQPPRVQGGLLGCDFSIEGGKYRLTRIYDGERWNPDLYSPLAQPGIDAQVGEYLLEIDGKPLTEATDLFEALEGKAGKQVKLKIGPKPDGSGSRVVTVLPVASDFALRFRSWTEDNRRTIDKETGGRIGYVHVPDTSTPGFREFNRFYYVQSNKQGMIVDDRFNHGGLINDWMVREMEKPLDYGSMTRNGKDWKIPPAAVYGPKVMLINEMAGSGGDIFPFEFRQHKVGKIIGKRTWGAMLSAYGFPLIDGGNVRAPDDAMYNPVTGAWIIENEGTPPDIDVELDPYMWRKGVDSQLEAAIKEILRDLAAHEPLKVKRPNYPDKSKLPFPKS